jgi:histidine triad (HIT) family protein
MRFSAGASSDEAGITTTGDMMNDPDCLFCKFVSGKIPANIVYETEHVVAFRDINPKAPVHILIIPRRHIATINDIEDSDAELVGMLVTAARDIAKKEGTAEPGFRLTMNCNKAAGQSVFHLHLHLLGGRNFAWPPG